MKRAHSELRKRVQAHIKESDGKVSQNDCAELVGADSGQFSRLMRGAGLPGVILAGRIFDVFGVEIPWWGEEDPGDGEPGAAEPAATEKAS